MAKTIGFLLMEINISGVTIFAMDKPIKTSASRMASSKECRSNAVANSAFSGVILSRSFRITPLLSVITIFAGFAPKALYKRVQEMAAAPAPEITMRTSSIFFSDNSKALRRAAQEIMAVPC